LKTADQQLQPNNSSLLRRLINRGGMYIDFRMGLIGAFVMASIVFGINYFTTHELWGATTAALKQGSYTALFGGIIMRVCEYLAIRIKHRVAALAAAMLIPSAIALCLTFGVHSMKGTPRPVASTLPTAFLVIPSTAVWGYMRRKHMTVTSEIKIN
jgi:hypothetical protein